MRNLWLGRGAALAVVAMMVACSGDDGDGKGDAPGTTPTTPVDSTPGTVTGLPTADTGTPITTDTVDTASSGESADTAPTADTGPLPTLTATCTLSKDNPMRAWCDATVDPPQPLEVWFSHDSGGGPERVHTSPDAVADHTIGLYFMRASSTYDYEVRTVDGRVAATGTVTTDAATGELAVAGAVTGTTSADNFGLQSPCFGGSAVIVDPQGSVVWGHEFPGNAEGVSFTEDETVMALLNGPDRVIEVDLMGREVLRLELGTDYPNATHHDVYRKDGRTYVLYQTNQQGMLLDGFYVFEGNTRLGSWFLADHHTPQPQGGPFGADYSHANSIWVDDAGDIYVSFRHLSGVVKVKGIDDPGFGDVVWRLAGEASDQRLGSDLVLSSAVTAEVSFERQHNVHRTSDGQLALFDNRSGFAEPSRLLHLDLDESAGTADIAEVFDLPVHCDFQGGAWSTAAGNPVATCAMPGTAYEFEPGVVDPVFTLDVSCQSAGFDSYIPRYVPLSW